MQGTTSWEEKGIDKGQRSLLLRQLGRKVGGASEIMVERVNLPDRETTSQHHTDPPCGSKTPAIAGLTWVAIRFD
jgi:hypothetical protein